MNKFATLHIMINKIIVLNNWQYEQRLEKKNKITYVSIAWSKRKKKQLYYDSQSMKLDTIWKISMNACNKTVQQSKTCYTCEKLNHFFRDCTQNKYKNKLKFYDNNNNNNSYILVTSIKSTHEENLCYVCWVNKTLWGRKSLAVYTTATRSRDDKTETMYQICLRWLHVREWMFLSF